MFFQHKVKEKITSNGKEKGKNWELWMHCSDRFLQLTGISILYEACCSRLVLQAVCWKAGNFYPVFQVGIYQLPTKKVKNQFFLRSIANSHTLARLHCRGTRMDGMLELRCSYGNTILICKSVGGQWSNDTTDLAMLKVRDHSSCRAGHIIFLTCAPPPPLSYFTP